MVAFTRDDEETFSKYCDEELSPFLPYLEVRNVKYSQAELKKAQEQLCSALRNLNIPGTALALIRENRVEIMVLESARTQFEEAVQHGKLVVPDYAQVKFTEDAGHLD